MKLVLSNPSLCLSAASPQDRCAAPASRKPDSWLHPQPLPTSKRFPLTSLSFVAGSWDSKHIAKGQFSAESVKGLLCCQSQQGLTGCCQQGIWLSMPFPAWMLQDDGQMMYLEFLLIKNMSDFLEKPYLWYYCQVFSSLLLPSFDFKWNFLITSQILYHANWEAVNIVQSKIAEK